MGAKDPAERTTHREHRRVGGAALRVSIGAALVALLLWRSDPSAVLATLRTADPVDVAVAAVAVLMSVVVGAFRWGGFLKEVGLRLSGREQIRLTLEGAFFNAFLPTGVGGDAYKALRLRGEPGAASRAGASVLLDRWAGMIGLAMVGVAGFTIQAVRGPVARPGTVAGLLGVGIVVASAALLWIGPNLLGGLHEPESIDGLKNQVTLSARAIVRVGRRPRATAAGLALGLASALLLLVGQIAVGNALGITLPKGALGGILLLAAVVTVLPVTLNGLGVREAIYVWTLAAYGISREEALAFALLVLASFLAASLVGGIVYLLDDPKSRSRPVLASRRWSGETFGSGNDATSPM